MVFSSKLASPLDSVSPCYCLPRSIYFPVTVHAKGTAVLLAISWPVGRGSVPLSPSVLPREPEGTSGSWHPRGVSCPSVWDLVQAWALCAQCVLALRGRGTQDAHQVVN